MSTATEVTHQAMTSEAGAILAGVLGTPWPETREAQKAIGWAVSRAAECRDVYGRLLNGDMDPLSVPAPDKGWWGDELECALEWAADEYLEAAKAARNRLAEYQKHEAEMNGGAR